ncbi:MAG: hypothetical protein GWN00_25790 [Aliifodinibius sp.]|nr:carboxypeptidase regulatory-like domain-containing protein [Fodinibius sp.]NIV14252.1 hypothetical protein [Fodinibius sp.]NIY28087.1 hypothetical protein [Fodinibius sp.]
MNPYRFFNFIIILSLNLIASGNAQVRVSGKAEIFFPIQSEINVSLLNQNGSTVDNTQTDENGYFSFEYVNPGYYTIRLSSNFIKTGVSAEFQVGRSSKNLGAYSLTPTTPSLISIIYMEACMNPGDFPSLVRSWRGWLSADNNIYKCMRMISTALTGGPGNIPSLNDTRERAFDVGSRAGVPSQISSKVADDMASTQAQVYLMGQNLGELASSIPRILEGSDNYYYNTSQYQLAQLAQSQLRQTIQLMQAFDMEINLDYFIFVSYLLGFHIIHNYVTFGCQ